MAQGIDAASLLLSIVMAYIVMAQGIDAASLLLSIKQAPSADTESTAAAHMRESVVSVANGSRSGIANNWHVTVMFDEWRYRFHTQREDGTEDGTPTRLLPCELRSPPHHMQSCILVSDRR